MADREMRVLCVDLQRDFTVPGSPCYEKRPCVDFITRKLIPFCREHEVPIAEIISDYRPPRFGHPFDHCMPGTAGYESLLTDDVRPGPVWIKAMHSPVWIRKNGGDAEKVPGRPYPDPASFTKWLDKVVGKSEGEKEIVLIGLTLDCCVLCTAQELCFRGYRVHFLIEGVDTYTGCPKEKKALLKVPLANWGQTMTWQQLTKRMVL